jgi:2-dehydro-3-deoxygluconokinase
VFAALSDSTAQVALEAAQAAQLHGTRVSYDLNYRDSLWRDRGGAAQAREVNRSIMPHVDVLFGNEEDFANALGFALPHGVPAERRSAALFGLLREVVAACPSLRAVVMRTSRAQAGHGRGWAALAVCEGETYETQARDVMILDKVGGGDGFASGFLYGLLTGRGAAWALECGLAHGALVMSTPGDTSMATLDEVLRAMGGAQLRIAR